MVQIKRERLSNKYCPECGERLQYLGRIHYLDRENDVKDDSKNMLVCIVRECNNCVPPHEGMDLPYNEVGG